MISLQANVLGQFIKRRKNILIVPANNKKMDTIPAAISLYYVCRKLGSNAGIYFEKKIPEQLKFLGPQNLGVSNLLLVEGIIFLGSGPPDLDLNDGKIVFVQNPSHMFILNSPTAHNKFFREGQNNIVDTKAGSVSEILARTIKTLDEELMVPETATALLAGLIATTQNFQLAVNPQTLFSAAYLVSKGADNEMIVKQLYKTRSLDMVKLWGLVISRFYYDSGKKIGRSFIGANDLQRGVLEVSNIPSVINELKNNFSDADVFVLGIGRDENNYLAVVHAKEPSVLKGFAQKYGLSIKNSSLVLRAASNENPSILTKKIVEEIGKV